MKKQAASILRRGIGVTSAWIRSSSALWKILIAATATSIVIAISLGVWRNVRSHVEVQPEYLVAPSAMEISPAPPWIHADIKAEVIRDAGLREALSILDEHLADSLSRRFALHPWIDRVASVKTSYPAHIKVELVYRRPVAMVEVHGGLLPIDEAGVLLPTEDFSPQAAQTYPRISGVQSSPLGPLGTRWGDTTVEAAAKLAAILLTDWGELELHHIEPLDSSAPASRQLVLQLVTRSGAQFVWGAPPGEETGDERKSTEKISTLKRLAAMDGKLDGAPQTRRNLRRESKARSPR